MAISLSLQFCSLVIVKKTIFLYGLALAVLVLIMRMIEYRFLVRDLTLEFYIGIVAVFFTVLGIWVGLRFTRKKIVVINPEFHFNEKEQTQRGISKRELEVLGLMAQGLANQEIADKLFVSLNTVKTHSSNLFSKLEVSRRTQAIQKAKELGLIP
jgi:DNA-binding CsgD family transcriptional regulator